MLKHRLSAMICSKTARVILPFSNQDETPSFLRDTKIGGSKYTPVDVVLQSASTASPEISETRLNGRETLVTSNTRYVFKQKPVWLKNFDE
jgi:hypothetical protein